MQQQLILYLVLVLAYLCVFPQCPRGNTLEIGDGTYSDSINGVKAGSTIRAKNDGKVIFAGAFNPGNAGFTMQGIVIEIKPR